MELKEIKCKRKGCNRTFKQFNSLQSHCSYLCKQLDKPVKYKKQKPIKKIGAKHQKLLSQYTKIRRTFLSQPENQYCPVTGLKVTEIHHMMGKVGFADDWAREFNVPLLIDERYFLAVHRLGHNKIESEPAWAKKMGYSVQRTN